MVRHGMVAVICTVCPLSAGGAIKVYRIALLLALLITAPPPPFTARWQGSSVARLVWQQPADVALTCLSRNATLIRCWADLPAGPVVIALGSVGPLDAAYRSHAGDVFVLALDGLRERAALRGVVRLAVVRR